MKTALVFPILLAGLLAGCTTVSTGERGFTPPPDSGQAETEKLGTGILAAFRDRDFAKLVENLPANFAGNLEEKDFLSSLERLEKQYGKIGGAEYEQPEGYCKILSGRDDFDKHFSVYCENQKEGEDFIRDIRYKDVEKLTKRIPTAIFFDQKKVYLVIKRDRDVMEAPIYRPVKEERSIKEAGEEVELIKSWISLIKSWI